MPFLPERKKLGKVEKFVTSLEDKSEYVINTKRLKQALNHGLILKKVHRVISFNQDEWLKPYIEINNKLRTEAKNDSEKDFFKQMINAVFGKTMENVKKNLSQPKEEETIWCRNQITIQQSFSKNIC